jgi:hypothetical protein
MIVESEKFGIHERSNERKRQTQEISLSEVPIPKESRNKKENIQQKVKLNFKKLEFNKNR